MEQEYLSVKQLAGEIGTNKLTIHRAINKLSLQGKLHKAGNRYMLSESQAKQIKSIILGENVSGNVSIVSNEIVSNPSEIVSSTLEIVSNVSEIVSSTPENVSNVSNVSKIVSSTPENVSNVSEIVSDTPKNVSNVSKIVSSTPKNVSNVSNKIVSNEIVSETHETQSMNIENTDKTYQPNGQITAAMENLTTALSAEQALHAGTIQKQLADHSVKEEPETEQPKQKQGLFSRLFGRKDNL